jgi:exopolysaccharide biosynthesis polyprenyl glycosylphosphotransferase
MLMHRLPLSLSPHLSSYPEQDGYAVEQLRRAVPERCVWALCVADYSAIVASYWLLLSSAGIPCAIILLPSLLAFGAMCILATTAAGLYRPKTVHAGIAHPLRALWCLSWSLAPALAFVTMWGPPETSHRLLPTLLDAVLIVLSARLVWHVCLWLALRRGACLERIVVLAESAAAARYFAARIERRTGGRLRTAACAAMPGAPAGVTVGWVRQTLASGAVDRVFLIDTGGPDTLCAVGGERLRAAGIDVIMLSAAPASGQVPAGGRAADPALHGLWTLTRPLSAEQAALKRGFDIVTAVAALLALSPIMAGIALAIKCDSEGPVFFRQQRLGLDGQVFRMWKFRSMRAEQQDVYCRHQTSRDDRRVTRVGRLLRRTSLDELPQLFNVLLGDMSIVGPRPHAIGMKVAGRAMQELASGYAERHQMKPGITGWAQVNGCRGELTDTRKLRRRVALDCHYIENWSFLGDIAIMLRTITLMLGDRHAY